MIRGAASNTGPNAVLLMERKLKSIFTDITFALPA
jgi:hypothetical protein